MVGYQLLACFVHYAAWKSTFMILQCGLSCIRLVPSSETQVILWHVLCGKNCPSYNHIVITCTISTSAISFLFSFILLIQFGSIFFSISLSLYHLYWNQLGFHVNHYHENAPFWYIHGFMKQVIKLILSSLPDMHCW